MEISPGGRLRIPHPLFPLQPQLGIRDVPGDKHSSGLNPGDFGINGLWEWGFLALVGEFGTCRWNPLICSCGATLERPLHP